MERKIGEIFEYKGEWFQCVKDDYPFSCQKCCFYNGADKKCSEELTGYCSSGYRRDGKEIIFKKLEKVGLPYISSRNKKKHQLYKCFYVPIVTKDKHIEIGDANFVGIEIKQNQEDMEENNLKRQMVVTANSQFKGIQEVLTKELSKVAEKGLVEDAIFKAFKELLSGKQKTDLKPFNLEAAKAGKPVCTRGGRKARIVCFDANDERPIIALLEFECENGDYVEKIETYYKNGKVHEDSEWNNDLMMLPEKHEGWVNVYKGGLLDSKVYDTRKEAFDKASPNDYIATVKIEWEE